MQETALSYMSRRGPVERRKREVSEAVFDRWPYLFPVTATHLRACVCHADIR
jgi:hypothetical protein